MHDTDDVFMDFYNVNWWAASGGFYSEYKSFYSPMNAYFAKNFVTESCLNLATPKLLRLCDLKSVFVYLTAISFANFYILWRIMKGLEYRWLWLLLMFFSFPNLYAMERGNYILIAQLFLSILILLDRLYKDATLVDSSKIKLNMIIDYVRALIISLMLCIKSYLVLVFFPLFIASRLRILFLTVVFTMALYVFFGFLYDPEEWLQFLANLQGFSSRTASNWIELTSSPTSLFAYPLLAHGLGIRSSLVSIIVVILFVYASIRLHIYVSIIIGSDSIEVDIFNMLLILLSLLFIFSLSPGFYAVVLLAPLFAYKMAKYQVPVWEKFLFILLMIPYFPDLYTISTDYRIVSSFGIESVLYKDLALTLQSFLFPVLLYLFFVTVTSYIPEDSEV
jgi:hypothetical protein